MVSLFVAQPSCKLEARLSYGGSRWASQHFPITLLNRWTEEEIRLCREALYNGSLAFIKIFNGHAESLIGEADHNVVVGVPDVGQAGPSSIVFTPVGHEKIVVTISPMATEQRLDISVDGAGQFSMTTTPSATAHREVSYGSTSPYTQPPTLAVQSTCLISKASSLSDSIGIDASQFPEKETLERCFSKCT